MNIDVSAKTKTQTQRREETQERVLSSACRMFGDNGFEKTSLRDIAADAGVTIGPIYHYFENKLKLFTVVNDLMEQEIIAMLEGFIGERNNFVIEEGWKVFLQLCKKPGFVQIVLIDSPHVLGHNRWKESAVIAKAYELFMMKNSNTQGVQSVEMDVTARFSGLDQELILKMLLAALAEAALMVGRNPDYDSSPLINNILSLLMTE